MTPRFNPSAIADELTTVVLAMRHDPRMSRWFETLQCMTPARRRVEIFRMRQVLMTSEAGDTDELTACLALLLDERIFAAAALAFQSE